MPALRSHSFTSGLGLRVLVAGLGIASATVAFAVTRPYALGLHDEGLYLAAAKSLRESGEYRLINLPSAPPQTKYPPAYSVVLALTAASLHLPSSEVKTLKAVNALWFALIVILTGALARHLSDDSPATVLAASLLASTSQGLFTHVDIICSDLMFIAVLLASILALARYRTRVGISALCGALLGSAILTRTIGVAALGSAGLRTLLQDWRRTLALVIPATALTAGWLLWCASHRATVGPLEQYYVVYERFAWLDLWSQPAYVWRMVSSNLINYAHALPWALGAPEMLTGLALAISAILGAWNVRKQPLLGDLALFGFCYLAALMAYPAVFARYLLPAAPIASALCGCSVGPADRAEVSWTLARRIGMACVVLLTIANVMELRHYATQPTSRVHTGFGLYLPFKADGFLQTAEWIRSNTAPGARLASANDTAYFTMTGRQGVRPWPHEPETYESAYDARPPQSEVDVPRELERLRIDYLVVDPYLPDLEGKHAARYVDLILHAPPGCWQHVFTSDDGLHRVYRRDASGGCTSR